MTDWVLVVRLLAYALSKPKPSQLQKYLAVELARTNRMFISEPP